MKFYTYEKGGGAEKVCYAEEGGGTTSLRVVLTLELEVLAILKEGGGGGGRKRFYPVLRGGATKNVDPQFSYFVAAPLPPLCP